MDNWEFKSIAKVDLKKVMLRRNEAGDINVYLANGEHIGVLVITDTVTGLSCAATRVHRRDQAFLVQLKIGGSAALESYFMPGFVAAAESIVPVNVADLKVQVMRPADPKGDFPEQKNGGTPPPTAARHDDQVTVTMGISQARLITMLLGCRVSSAERDQKCGALNTSTLYNILVDAVGFGNHYRLYSKYFDFGEECWRLRWNDLDLDHELYSIFKE